MSLCCVCSICSIAFYKCVPDVRHFIHSIYLNTGSLSLSHSPQCCNSHTFVRHCLTLLNLEQYWTALLTAFVGCLNSRVMEIYWRTGLSEGEKVCLVLSLTSAENQCGGQCFAQTCQNSIWMLVLGLQVHVSVLVTLQVRSSQRMGMNPRPHLSYLMVNSNLKAQPESVRFLLALGVVGSQDHLTALSTQDQEGSKMESSWDQILSRTFHQKI